MNWTNVRRILLGFLLAGAAIIGSIPRPQSMLLPALLAAPFAVLRPIGFVWLDCLLACHKTRQRPGNLA